MRKGVKIKLNVLFLNNTSVVGKANYQTIFHVTLKECGMNNTLTPLLGYSKKCIDQ